LALESASGGSRQRRKLGAKRKVAVVTASERR
jgi:hypothetical protein